MTGDQHNTDRLPRLGMVASAIAGRTVRVAPAGTGESAWTDGRTIFVDADLPGRDQLQSLAVQASLLAAGSLEPDVIRALTRRPRWPGGISRWKGTGRWRPTNTGYRSRRGG
ncbi:hypothetical protein I545_1846 [Mycobacterium kansasii 662]|uniref:Uncharacterized protein n=2 Tax=Mycobacterium kansasii TaxID=1768 RepID=A0A1V3XLB6_MYCKA|nr:hypothetical protein [Mycobacterium kansasii]EUA19900.1 hypothetical protein I545_1846 [Mycobacterium kansasii 662]OOK79989.1 hypothetical protein BZL29_2500 [Mycobacterium kansasii]